MSQQKIITSALHWFADLTMEEQREQTLSIGGVSIQLLTVRDIAFLYSIKEKSNKLKDESNKIVRTD